MVRRADACLYGAKHNGRNLVINQNDARIATLKSMKADLAKFYDEAAPAGR